MEITWIDGVALNPQYYAYERIIVNGNPFRGESAIKVIGSDRLLICQCFIRSKQAPVRGFALGYWQDDPTIKAIGVRLTILTGTSSDITSDEASKSIDCTAAISQTNDFQEFPVKVDEPGTPMTVLTDSDDDDITNKTHSHTRELRYLDQNVVLSTRNSRRRQKVNSSNSIDVSSTSKNLLSSSTPTSCRTQRKRPSSDATPKPEATPSKTRKRSVRGSRDSDTADSGPIVDSTPSPDITRDKAKAKKPKENSIVSKPGNEDIAVKTQSNNSKTILVGESESNCGTAATSTGICHIYMYLYIYTMLLNNICL